MPTKDSCGNANDNALFVEGGEAFQPATLPHLGAHWDRCFGFRDGLRFTISFVAAITASAHCQCAFSPRLPACGRPAANGQLPLAVAVQLLHNLLHTTV